MITLIIGIILIVFGAKNISYIREGKSIFYILAGVICLVIALLIPVGGFTEMEQVEQVELIELKIEDEETEEVVAGTYYLQCIDGRYVYAYDNSEVYGLAGGAYEEAVIYGNTVKVYESKECKTPIFKKFKTKAKKSWYTLASYWCESEYVFYIPEGTIKS